MAKKITKVSTGKSKSTGAAASTKKFVASDENKAKAKQFRVIAILSWIVAIGFEIWAILKLKENPVNTTWLVSLIVADLIFVVIGSLLWKKSNRLDPASEKDKFRFFVQNQLGLIIAFIAFLPLVILVFTNKNMSGKQKGIIGSIAVVALVIAGITGTDFNPPSQEKYAEQTAEVEALNNGIDNVFWTKSGRSYHLFSDCGYINSDRTTEIFEGTVADARSLKNITDLCDRCENQAIKNQSLEELPSEILEEEAPEMEEESSLQE